MAEQLFVRSGEHDGFSRIVIPYPRGTSWTISKDEDEIILHTNRSDFTYDVRDVFRLIPRNRVVSMLANDENNTLIIKIGEKFYNKAYQLDSGPVVIDILDTPVSSPARDHQTSGRVDIQKYSNLLWQDNITNSNSGKLSTITQTQSKTSAIENNTRVGISERQLLDSLSRAVSQGIFTVDPARKLAKTITGPSLSVADSDIAPAYLLPLQSETVFERDMDMLNDQAKVLTNGQSCPSDRNFSLETWISDADQIKQFVQARNGLIGEFDRPDTAAVERLIRLYLALGFGVEAKATITAFNFDAASAGPLGYIADVIDGMPTPSDSPISRMAACNGKVALWAFMGGPIPGDPGQINVNAVQSSFSALPSQIRDILGPALVEKLLKIGHSDVAEAIRNALRRSNMTGATPLVLAQAQLDLASGQPLAAEKSLSVTTPRNDLDSAQSLVLFVEARLMRDQSIDKGTTDDLAAQLHQNGPSDLGYRLRRALILAHGSVGEFDEAFVTLAQWPESDQPELRTRSRGELVEQLSRVPDDMIFAKQIFKQKIVLQQADLLPTLRIKLADRLSKLGFSAAADDILTPAIRGTASGRLALARSALAEKDGAAALAHLSGLDGNVATQLRADAYLALGEHANAAAILRSLGDDQGSAREAWRGASWEIVREHGSEDERAAIAPLASAPAPEAADAPVPGPITRANSLISQSQDERALLNRLLTAY
ncbi:MAG TPA: hypothetical protein VGC40_08735 [Paenirhodobacter sp.]